VDEGSAKRAEHIGVQGRVSGSFSFFRGAA
jgi:hypothetical protein